MYMHSAEIEARGLHCDGSEAWYALLRIIEEHENDPKTFSPYTDALKSLLHANETAS